MNGGNGMPHNRVSGGGQQSGNQQGGAGQQNQPSATSQQSQEQPQQQPAVIEVAAGMYWVWNARCPFGDNILIIPIVF